jgi:hypothetical protein
VFLIFTLFNIQPSKAQPPFHLRNKPLSGMSGQENCWESSDLALTEAQTKAFKGLKLDYTAEAMPLRRERMSIKFELRHLIRDPNVQSNVLFDRQKKISDIQVKLDNLSFFYQIKARSILTKEQLELLPQDCSLEMSPEYEIPIGIGRGPRRGLR